VDAGKKVLVAFRIGDIRTEAFTYEKGEKKGQAGASLKGRLLFLNWIKVDGETVYEAKLQGQRGSGPPTGWPCLMLPQRSNNSSKVTSSPLDRIQGAPKGAFYNLRTALIVIANPSGGTISPGHGVLQINLEIIMNYAQAVEMPALPEVEEVSLTDIEDELLNSSHFCDMAWLIFSSPSTDAAVLTA
jgi:hypothetical protein